MGKVVRTVGIALAAIAGLVVVAYGVAWGVARYRYERTWVAHDAGFPIPFPLGDAELARVRAIENGKRIVETRTACTGCHGQDFGGADLLDMLLLGHWAAPNLTTGRGSVTLDYTASDWDHAVRHGLRKGGRTSSMPAVEFTNLSDHELSDIVAYIRSQPPVDRTAGTMRFGPVLAFVFAGDPDWVVASHIDHQKPHPVEPPLAAATAAYGEHLVQVCRGCHGPGLSGGKIQGDPNMPIVANLTPHETGLRDWTEADFVHAIRSGKRPDGSGISGFMPWKLYGRMSDDELRAIYAYLRTVPPKVKGER